MGCQALYLLLENNAKDALGISDVLIGLSV